MGARESEEALSSQRMEHDAQVLQKCISTMFGPNEPGLQILGAIRLGKRSDDAAQKPRPLKVVLESPDDCARVLRRTYKLKGEPIRILRDLSPEDRERMKSALDELKERRSAGETDLSIVDFRVVKKPPRVRWIPIVLYPSAVGVKRG
jgi:hypothetical protein